MNEASTPLSELLEKHRELVKGATKGPWFRTTDTEHDSLMVEAPDQRIALVGDGSRLFEQDRSDASHIATADPEVMAAYIAVAGAAPRYIKCLIVESSSADPTAGDDWYEAEAALHEVLQRKLGGSK